MKTPHTHDDPSRTTPRGLARYAADFMEAALATDAKMGSRSGFEIVAPIPVMFLTGQAIELILKAFLLQKGLSLRQLRHDYGHDLKRALRKAKELGLSSIVDISEEEQSVLELLDTLYSSKQLQYIVTGAKTFPVFGPLAAVAMKLIYAISPTVGYEPENLPLMA